MTLNSLIQHVVENNCEDPDCEIHNIHVAAEEAVIRPSDIAFWLAGAAWVTRHTAAYRGTVDMWQSAMEHAKQAHDKIPVRTQSSDLQEDR